ncbi:GNAT family N-acetyltransferase [Mammaliicoccus sciuri]|uniref:GNAT family N-acetyltransferase n=1 Tax=Mammaliicoccus sciuri TaxID=1296 RepID=UPI0034DDBF58
MNKSIVYSKGVAHIISTNKCIIKNIELNDYNKVKGLYLNKKVRWYLGGIISSEKQLLNIFDEMIKHSNLYFTVYSKSNVFLGLISLTLHHNKVDTELSYQFLPEFWGKGYAFDSIITLLEYAFIHFNLNRVIAETQKSNIYSCNLLEKIGMRVEKSLIRFGEEQVIYSIEPFNKVI